MKSRVVKLILGIVTALIIPAVIVFGAPSAQGEKKIGPMHLKVNLYNNIKALVIHSTLKTNSK